MQDVHALLNKIGKSDRDVYNDFLDSGLSVDVVTENKDIIQAFDDRTADSFENYHIVDCIDFHGRFIIMLKGSNRGYLPSLVRMEYEGTSIKASQVA